MQSTTLLHVAIDWDNLDQEWKYVTVDNHGITAHEELPHLNADGCYSSYGVSMRMCPVQPILFGRDKEDPLEPADVLEQI